MITKNITKAVSLLKKANLKLKDEETWVFTADSCPVATAYGLSGVESCSWWKHGLTLAASGWDERMFRDFIEWHDTIVSKNGKTHFPNREKLKKLLEVGKHGNHSRKGKQVRRTGKRKVAQSV